MSVNNYWFYTVPKKRGSFILTEVDMFNYQLLDQYDKNDVYDVYNIYKIV